MHSACRPVAVLAANSIGELARIAVWLVPGRSSEFAPPISEPVWRDLLASLEEAAGARLPEMVVMRPSDPRRARLMWLALDERRRARLFVKLTRNPPNPLARRLLTALAVAEPPFWFPRERVGGTVEDPPGLPWSYAADEPMPAGPHWPARLTASQRHGLAASISALVPAERVGLVAVHGDLGPWNVRRLGGGRLAIVDWENATWAPPAADEMWHALTGRLIGRRPPAAVAEMTRAELGRFFDAGQVASAARFWLRRWEEDEPAEVVEGVPKSGKLRSFEKRLQSALTALRATQGPGTM